MSERSNIRYIVVERTVKAMSILQKNPCTIKELALKLNLSYETARNYINALNRYGLIKEGENGSYCLKKRK